MTCCTLGIDCKKFKWTEPSQVEEEKATVDSMMTTAIQCEMLRCAYMHVVIPGLALTPPSTVNAQHHTAAKDATAPVAVDCDEVGW